MFLKFRYRLGYESLCREVSDSITWRRFCRIALDVSVPHPTTLMKLTTRCGRRRSTDSTRPCWPKLLRRNCCAPTGFVPTPRWCRLTWPIPPTRGCWPRRCGGSQRRVSGSRPLVARCAPECGIGPGRRASAHTRSRRNCVHGRRWREEAGTAAVLRSTGELAGLAETAAREAERLLVNAKRAIGRAQAKAAALAVRGEHDAAAGRRRGRLVRAVNDLAKLLDATRQIAAQTRQRIAGHTPHGASRRVSLHDGDARPIAKGRLGKPVETGNPPDAPQLAPAIGRVKKRTGRAPGAVTADRGYGEKRVEDDLHDLGVRTVVIPRKGKPGKARRTAEHRPTFRRTIKWRTGCEGRISTLKRGYGWDRTRIDGTEGTRIWTGHGVLTHNSSRSASSPRNRQRPNHIHPPHSA